MKRDYEKWNLLKDSKPPFGEVVEVGAPKGWMYSRLERDYFALVSIEDTLWWITPSPNELEYKEAAVKYWRFIPPDIKGRRVYIDIINGNRSWDHKLRWKKEI